MSLENVLKRIADALDTLVVLAKNQGPAVQVDKGDTFTPAPPEAITLPTTADGLKALAQKIAAKLPDGGIGPFTDYVRNNICARFGVKKLLEIPLEGIAQAAADLIAYGKGADNG